MLFKEIKQKLGKKGRIVAGELFRTEYSKLNYSEQSTELISTVESVVFRTFIKLDIETSNDSLITTKNTANAVAAWIDPS